VFFKNASEGPFKVVLRFINKFQLPILFLRAALLKFRQRHICFLGNFLFGTGVEICKFWIRGPI